LSPTPFKSNPLIILVSSSFSPVITSETLEARSLFNLIFSKLPDFIFKYLSIIIDNAFYPVAEIAIPSFPTIFVIYIKTSVIGLVGENFAINSLLLDPFAIFFILSESIGAYVCKEFLPSLYD